MDGVPVHFLNRRILQLSICDFRYFFLDDLNLITGFCKLQCIGKRGVFHTVNGCLRIHRCYYYADFTFFTVIRLPRVGAISVASEFDEETCNLKCWSIRSISFLYIIQSLSFGYHHYT